MDNETTDQLSQRRQALEDLQSSIHPMKVGVLWFYLALSISSALLPALHVTVAYARDRRRLH